MFFIIGVDNGTNEIGTRRCGIFSCCGTYGAIAMVTCTFQRFTLFFIPLFRFGKRYFVTCPNCGTVYELSKEEGRRLERDASAEIDPNQMYALHRSSGRICPDCHAAVDPNAHFCPNCGTKLY